ncbi:hypothetical protein ACMD2_08616, partial [Ananas comosus]
PRRDLPLLFFPLGAIPPLFLSPRSAVRSPCRDPRSLRPPAGIRGTILAGARSGEDLLATASPPPLSRLSRLSLSTIPPLFLSDLSPIFPQESALSSTSCLDPRRDLRRWGSGEYLLLLLPLPIARLASPRALSVAPAPCSTKCRADSGALRGHLFFSSPPCHTLGSVQPYDRCVLRAGDGGDGAVEGAAEAAPVLHSKRRLRLFGVNLGCAPDLEEAPQTARSVFGLVNQTARTPTPLAPYYWSSS